MSDLIISVFRNQAAAFAAGEQLAALQQAAGTEPEDIVVVSRNSAGRIAINQSIDLSTGAPLGGGGWGVLIGLMFLDGRDPRSESQGLAAQLVAAGLDRTFLADVVESLMKGGAAVGMRVRLLGKERVMAKLDSLQGSPRIHWTRLDARTEEALTDMIGQIPQAALGRPRELPAD
ncbi:MAG: DUF1269 domain-containing protein [Tabrizicola flagellatus]|uniref:DUF1269 domain-containing protein n=1 Tax=Tabrizicola flagellatus TaxID=2593021 RepID=UPI00391D4C89